MKLKYQVGDVIQIDHEGMTNDKFIILGYRETTDYYVVIGPSSTLLLPRSFLEHITELFK